MPSTARDSDRDSTTSLEDAQTSVTMQATVESTSSPEGIHTPTARDSSTEPASYFEGTRLKPIVLDSDSDYTMSLEDVQTPATTQATGPPEDSMMAPDSRMR